MVSLGSTLKICSPDFVGKRSKEIGIAVSKMLSLNFDGRLNADAEGINSAEVACLSVIAKIFAVSLIGLSATVGWVSQEERNNRREINIRVKAFIELLLKFRYLWRREFIDFPARYKRHLKISS